MAFDAGDIESRLTVNMTEFDTKMDAAEQRVARFEGKDATMHVRADTADAEAKLAALDAQADDLDKTMRVTSSDSGGLGQFHSRLGLIAAGITTLLPMVPTLAGGALALAGAMAAAGGATLGFGTVAVTTIKQAVDANQQLAQAQQAVNDATTNAGRQEALEKQSALIKQLGPDTIALGQAFKDISGDWTSFADSFTGGFVGLAAQVQHLEDDLLPKLAPTVSNSIGVVSALLDKVDQAANSAGGSRFFTWLSTEGPDDAEKLAVGIGHIGAGITDLLENFSPVERQLVNGFDNISASFERWAGNTGTSASFQKFMATVEKDGPQLVHTLGDVGDAVGHIAGSMGPLLPIELQFIDHIATLIDDHPAITATLADIYAGYSALRIISTIITPLSIVVGLASTGAAKLGLFAAGETAVGDAAQTASVKVGDLAVAEDAAIGKSATLLGMLTQIGVAAAGVAAFFGSSWAFYGTDQQSDAGAADSRVPGVATSTVAGAPASLQDLFNQVEKTHPIAPNAGTLDVDEMRQFIQQYGTSTQRQALAQIVSGPTSVNAAQGPGITTLVNGGYIGSVNAAAGSSGADPSASDYLDQFNSNKNLPGSMLPLSGGGSSSGPTTAQTLQALMALEGVNIGQSLLFGIQTGTNQIDTLMQQLQTDVGSKAQPIADQFKSMFDTALQAGQAAAATLKVSVGSLPQMGSITDVTMGASGQIVSTQESPIVAQLQTVLGGDKQFVSDITKATQLGLPSDLLSQFVQAGPSSDSQLESIIAGGKSTISQVNSLDAQINGMANTYGLQQSANSYLSQLVAEMQQLLVAVQQQAPQLANALNSTAKSQQQKAATTPSKGVLAR